MVLNIATILEEAGDMVLGMVRQQERGIRARKPALVHQGQVLKAARCLCIEEYQREDSLAETLRELLELIWAPWRSLRTARLFLSTH